MGIAYRRTVAMSPAPEGSALAPLLSIFGHAIVLPILLTATIAVRETPRFDDFNLFGFAGGEVLEAQIAQPKELTEAEPAAEASLVQEISDLAGDFEAGAIQEVTEMRAAAPEIAPDPIDEAVTPASAEASDVPEQATIAETAALTEEIAQPPAAIPEPSTIAAVLEPAIPREIVPPMQYSGAEPASALYPPAEQLAMTPVSLAPVIDRAIEEPVEAIEPSVAEEPLQLASLVLEQTGPEQPDSLRLPARKSLSADGRKVAQIQQAKLPYMAADRRLAQSSPELWQVVSALRRQLARCWAVGPAAGGAPDFIDVEVAFDRTGRLKLARVRDAARLLQDRAYLREARRARQALKTCSPFALPNEHYGLWRHFTMRFVLSAS